VGLGLTCGFAGLQNDAETRDLFESSYRLTVPFRPYGNRSTADISVSHDAT
jgi:hypothetical protein